MKAYSIAVAAAAATLPGSAMAADLYVPPAAPMMSAPAPSANWEGPYVGAQIGYAWGTATPPTAPNIPVAGFLGGVQAGYNFRIVDPIVLGIEGDIGWANETGTAGNVPFTVGLEGSLRGRAGLDLGQWMPYLEAGVAFANATVSSNPAAVYTGWTAGGGVEVMLADNVSANLEGRYTNYGNQTFGGGSYGLTDSSVRIGVNWHF